MSEAADEPEETSRDAGEDPRATEAPASRTPWLPVLVTLALAYPAGIATGWLAFGDGTVAEPVAEVTAPVDAGPDEEALARAREEAIRQTHPNHGLVKSKQLRLRARPDRDAEVVGWIRRGERVPVAGAPSEGSRCAGGWYEIHPRGFACSPHEVIVDEEPPTATFHLDPPARMGDPLPYDYFFVTRANAPQFMREPTVEEHRETLRYMRRLQHFQEEEPNKLERFLEGRIRDEPTKPEVVLGFLDRGNYIASPPDAERDGDRFVRTAQGRVMLASQLRQVNPSTFEGVHLDEDTTLPIAWVNRPARNLIARERDDGNYRWVDDEEGPSYERYQRLAEVPRRLRMGRYFVHEMAEERYLKEWFVSVASAVTPTFPVDDDEVWIHVNVAEQTLVAYRGQTPIFATLVSTGNAGHETPRGDFRILRKFVGRTMDGLGTGGAGGYRIEDVPHTQYFYRSLALHAAFWHDRFGTPRSHGCVNLSPRDALTLFEWTSPDVPERWWGVPAQTPREAAEERVQGPGTIVWITR